MSRFFKSWINDILKQLFGKSPSRSGDILISRHAYIKMREYGLTEKYIKDVFAHGEMIKKNMIIRKYNGYQIGLIFDYDEEAPVNIIISCWKRKCRS
jgi:hypothetical protein